MERYKEEYKKKLVFLGLINKYLNKFNSEIIILGGFAAQFYTAGEYLTTDIDLACENRVILKEIFNALNFEKVGRHYFSDELNLAIEIPTSSISENQQERLQTIEIEGYKVLILGIEDLIIDRLNAFTHWQSLEDGRIAKELLLLHYEKIDWDYLENRARTKRINSDLQKMKSEVEIQRDKNGN
jgi:predicted nucleotidyltransferase